jgi:signal transduction histidine kinase/PAS domain-containing protein
VNHDDRDVTETSRLSTARVRPADDRGQTSDPEDRSRVRETDTTSKALPPHADSLPVRPMRVDAASVLNALGSAIAVVGSDWRIQMMNRQWERIFGRSAAECTRRDLFAAFPFFAEAHAASMLRAARADGATRHFDLELASPDALGIERYGVRVVCNDDEQLIIDVTESAAASGRDAAEHNAENASLRRLARQMAAIADSGELLDLLCSAATEQCDASGAAVLRGAGSEGEVVAATGAMTLGRERRFPLDGSVAEEALASRDVVSVENFTAGQRPLARIVPELQIGPMLAAPLVAHDRLLGILTVVRGQRAPAFSSLEAQRLRVIADHAALAMWKAELLEQSRAADHAKGRFLATISHELRTPLTALTGYEELLADEVMGPLTESQTDVLERMRSVTHHLTVMIEEVLAFSSIEAGREVVRPTEFLAEDLVRAAAAIVEPLARQKRLRLICDLPADPIRVTSDIDKVRQIVVNLAGNAVKFTDHGEVRIALSELHSSGEADGEDRREVRFAVTDTGAGIAPEDARRLFRPFSQVDAGLTRRHGGTGLGLYISQRLAQLLGGRIDVESEIDVGSTFTLAIPAD